MPNTNVNLPFMIVVYVWFTVNEWRRLMRGMKVGIDDGLNVLSFLLQSTWDVLEKRQC